MGRGRIRRIRLRSPERTARPSATAATHATKSSGSRLGEQAAISAPSSPSHAEAVQDERTLNAASSTNGAARCTSTPPMPPGVERHDEARRRGPEQAADHAERAAAGEARGREPAAGRGDGQREDPEPDDRGRRMPERDRAEHGEHRRERVGGADEAAAERMHAPADVPPERVEGPERQQLAAGERVRTEQRLEQHDRDGQHREHGRHAAAREEVQRLLAVRRLAVVAGERPRCRTSRHGCRSGAMEAQPASWSCAMRDRDRAIAAKRVPKTTRAASSSAGAEPGALRRIWPIARRTATGRIDSQCSGHAGAAARRRGGGGAAPPAAAARGGARRWRRRAGACPGRRCRRTGPGRSARAARGSPRGGRGRRSRGRRRSRAARGRSRRAASRRPPARACRPPRRRGRRCAGRTAPGRARAPPSRRPCPTASWSRRRSGCTAGASHCICFGPATATEGDPSTE